MSPKRPKTQPHLDTVGYTLIAGTRLEMWSPNSAYATEGRVKQVSGICLLFQFIHSFLNFFLPLSPVVRSICYSVLTCSRRCISVAVLEVQVIIYIEAAPCDLPFVFVFLWNPHRKFCVTNYLASQLIK